MVLPSAMRELAILALPLALAASSPLPATGHPPATRSPAVWFAATTGEQSNSGWRFRAYCL